MVIRCTRCGDTWDWHLPRNWWSERSLRSRLDDLLLPDCRHSVCYARTRISTEAEEAAFHLGGADAVAAMELQCPP